MAGFAVLAVGALAITEYEIRDTGVYWDSPEREHGPLTMVSQTLQVNHAYLSRIEVWATAVGGEGAIFMRLTPVGSARPIRESRAAVHHPRWSEQTVDLKFVPVPDSQGQTYDLTIGALVPTPHVFLGLSTDNPNSLSAVRINGEPDRWANDLALRTYWRGRAPEALAAMIQQDPRTLTMLGVMVIIATLSVGIVTLWVLSAHRG